MTTSSSAVLPARSPRPLIVHSIWVAPFFTPSSASAVAHAEVVVTVNRHGDVLNAAHVLIRYAIRRPNSAGKRVPRGVRNVDDGRARIDDALDDLHEEIVVGATGVLGVKLHVVHVFLGIAHAVLPRARGTGPR